MSKTLRQLCAMLMLSVVLAISASAGDISAGGRSATTKGDISAGGFQTNGDISAGGRSATGTKGDISAGLSLIVTLLARLM